jgi:prepilin-type N-terminal cleavage/methylation domain-containing protein
MNNSSETSSSSVESFRVRSSECETLIHRLTSTRSEGFTLLEVMLSVAILSVIVTVIYASFSTAESSVKQAEEIRDQTDLARTLITRLSDDIHDAYCDATGRTIFNGRKQETDTGDIKRRLDSIELTTLTNSRTRNSKETDLWLVGYFFKEKPDGSGSILMRKEKRDLSGTESLLEGVTEYEITDRVDELHLAYFKSSYPMLEEFGSLNKCELPRIVAITIAFDDGSVYSTKVSVGNVYPR